MSNFPKPDELEELLELYSEKLDVFSGKFNPVFKEISVDLKDKVDLLRNRIEKYANYSRNHQLQHLILSDLASQEIQQVHGEVEQLHSKIGELERIFHLGKDLL